MFRPVASKVDFSALEEDALRLWEQEDIFARSVSERLEDKLFVLYEGPPTANASPGIHHVLSRAFKDVIPRYKTMKGYRAPRKGGWDTHGLPVELEVERELGLKSKREIETYGVERFNQRCRESVMRYVKEWEALTRRIAFWVDMEHPYRTYDNDYIETGWWILKRLWDSNLLFEDSRVTPHCPRCVTSLSDHEVALGYEDADDPSAYVKFKLDLANSQVSSAVLEALSEPIPHYLLAWTTTPWTLPGNTALAVAPNAEYIMVEHGEERLILAEALAGHALRGDYKVMTRLSGKELVGLAYEPLFRPRDYGVIVNRLGGTSLQKTLEGLQDFKASVETYPVMAADFVSLEEGTGIVHIAPAFGEDDYKLGKERELYFVQPVDLEGKVTGSYPFSGKFVKEADPLILEDLKERGLLYRRDTIRHTYPFCWRCHAPLLYYAKSSWYIRTTAVKDRLMGGNQEINWYPEHIKEGRFGDWLRNNVDWAVSRERYWGTPLPVWWCRGRGSGDLGCGHIECIGSRNELKAKAGLQGWADGLDLHRPYIDQVTYSCPQCGGTMRRLLAVLDCWFDAGAMPFAQWHYPFENKEAFQRSFPADYICEAVDQTRGWFYTLHALSILLRDEPCYKNVICLGHILDDKGEKMSKSRGNVVEPWKVINKHGADALRWYLYTASPAGNPRRFSEELVAGTVKKFLLPLWNVYSFFVTYANIDKFDPHTTPSPEPTSDLDRWILSELNSLIEKVEGYMEAYDPTAAARGIEAFVDGLSNWYVRRSRRRFWKSENDADKLSAHSTLYRCLATLAHLLAPFTPFLAETMYQNLVRYMDTGAPESVHLASFPVAEPSQIDEELNQDTRLAMKLSSLGRAARSKVGIKVRQPIAAVHIVLQNKAEWQLRDLKKRIASWLEEELNTREVFFTDSSHPLSGNQQRYEIVQESDYAVVIDKMLTPELKAEGLAREVVHRLQTMRKEAGFDIADYIDTYFAGDEVVRQVIKQFAGYIQQETLSQQLLEEAPPPDAYSQSHRIDGREVALAVRRALRSAPGRA